MKENKIIDKGYEAFLDFKDKYGIREEDEFKLYQELEKIYRKEKKRFDWNKLKLNIKTNILMMLPMGLYIWILKKKIKTRLQNYSGVLGTNPISYPVYNGVVLVDLNQLQI